MAAMSQSVSLKTPLTIAKVQKELGEEILQNPTVTGSSTHMGTADTGSATMVSIEETGNMTMDPAQLVLGGSMVTVLGQELSELMILMRQLSTTAQITRNTCALIWTMVKSTLKTTAVIGIGMPGESATT